MSELGKRYECGECGTVVLCVRPGPVDFVCDEHPMAEMTMEELPSGD